eukprot:1154603-Pelagomonas_calceolata.AAC.2
MGVKMVYASFQGTLPIIIRSPASKIPDYNMIILAYAKKKACLQPSACGSLSSSLLRGNGEVAAAKWQLQSGPAPSAIWQSVAAAHHHLG